MSRRRVPVPSVDGIISADDVRATVEAIARIQLPDGNIPWNPGDHTDPWNLVEAAMALDVGGRHLEAARAYDWLRGAQLLNDFRSYIGKFWVVKPKASAIDSLLENLRRAA